MKKFTTALTSALLAATIAAPSFAEDSYAMTRLIAFGIDREVVKTLSAKEIASIERAMNNGSDSDARMAVNSILLSALMMDMAEMMKK